MTHSIIAKTLSITACAALVLATGCESGSSPVATLDAATGDAASFPTDRAVEKPSVPTPDASAGDAAQAMGVVTAKSAALRLRDPQIPMADSTTLAADNAAFAFDAYRKLATQNENLVFSPASISIALAMAYGGAAGTTASEMAAALHFRLPAERLHPAFNALDLELASRGQGKLASDGGPMRVNIVNSAWAEKTYIFLPTYLDLLAQQYGAGVNLVDFRGAPDPSRLLINGWVAEKTENRIKDLLPQGSVDSMTALVLTNAVYFNAAWQTPFDEKNVPDAAFTLLDGSQVTVKLMKNTLPAAPAVAAADYKAVALPYQDDRLSLLVVVPELGKFAAVEATLDADKLTAIATTLTAQQVELGLPRYRIETGTSLTGLLKALGMVAAFSADAADFSGMDGTRSLFVQDVIHKAFIAVGEKGTEAAAATAVIMGRVSLPTGLSIQATRPFMYFLRDQPTGAILFMGRVMDPSR